jgi:hypothetical protein
LEAEKYDQTAETELKPPQLAIKLVESTHKPNLELKGKEEDN